MLKPDKGEKNKMQYREFRLDMRKDAYTEMWGVIQWNKFLEKNSFEFS